MKWFAIWMLLTGIYLAGWLLCGWLLGTSLEMDTESLAHLAAVPLAETAALWALGAFRRMFREG